MEKKSTKLLAVTDGVMAIYSRSGGYALEGEPDPENATMEDFQQVYAALLGMIPLEECPPGTKVLLTIRELEAKRAAAQHLVLAINRGGRSSIDFRRCDGDCISTLEPEQVFIDLLKDLQRSGTRPGTKLQITLSDVIQREDSKLLLFSDSAAP